MLTALRTFLLRVLPRVLPPCCEPGATVLLTEKNLLLWWCYWLVGAASEPLRLRVAGERRWPAS
jgi:hypothetical protein